MCYRETCYDIDFVAATVIVCNVKKKILKFHTMPFKKQLFQNLCYLDTVWKFHDFSITQILREINFRDSRCAKSAILIR